MLDDVRKYLRAGLGALTPQATEDVATAVVARAQGMAEQLSALASGFLEWSAEARASLLQEVRDLVARQVQEMGLATKEDVRSLQARLDRLENAGRAGGTRTGGTRTATARKTTSRASRSKPSRSKASPSKASTSKASTARATRSVSASPRGGARARPRRRAGSTSAS